MKCTVVVLVSLFALFVTGVRSAPQRGIDFLPRDEEVQAIVKPIAADSDVPEQQRQLGADEDDGVDELQQREQPEVPATVDPVENEQQTEDPAETVTELAEDDLEEDPLEDQFTEEDQEEVTDEPEDTVQNSTPKTDSPSQTVSDVTTPSQKDATPAKDESRPTESDAAVDYPSEEGLTTDPIVVAEQSSTESTEDSNRFAEDVNSLADDSTNQVRYGEEDNQDQPEPQARPTPEPKVTPPSPPTLPPQPPVYNGPQHSTEPPTASPTAPASDEYDSKSFESSEDDEQKQLKFGPNDQFRPLAPWYSATRLADYDQWQRPASTFPQRSSWQPRTSYQPSSFDGFHGHGFHRSSWH